MSFRSFLDDTARDLLYALRTVKRAPLAAFTIVSTVALGLGLVAVAFTALNALLFRVDAVPDVHEMVAVARPKTSTGASERFTRAQFDALRRDTDVFADSYAVVSQVDSRVDGRLIFGTFVTGNFFHVVRVAAAMGRTLTPADDEPSAGHAVMVLSSRGWDRLFARDPAVVGRRLVINGVPFEIVGVMPDRFRGLSVTPDDYWAPLSTLGHVRPIHRGRDASVAVDIVGRLKPALSPQTARAGLAIWDARQSIGTASDRGASNIILAAKRGTVELTPDTALIFAPLFLAFGLILLIGCANVANLLLARGVARQREIGIQLSLGATRRRIVRQLLTESLLLALAAAAAGLVISRVVLQTIIYAVVTSMPPDIGDVRLLVPGTDWRVLLFLVAGGGVSTIFFGLVPALQATRLAPVNTLRGEVLKDTRPGRARSILIGLQVSAAALLLICAAVFLRSALAAATFDSGMRTSDTIAVQIANEQHRAAMVQAITAEASIAEVAASWPQVPRPAAAEAGGAKAAVAYELVSPEFFSVLGIPIVQGRPFTPAERSSALSLAVVSETAARAMWPDGDAVGRAVRLDPEPASDARRDEPRLESQTFTVVGVVRDVAGFRIAPFTAAVVYVPTSSAMPGTSLIARVHGDPELARQAVLTRLTAIDPDMARQVVTMRTLARMDTYFLQIAFWMTVSLGALALALTVSGLFSVLSYLVEQRAREIGVRMAVGATTRDITRLVLSQSFRPVGAGLAIGGGAAVGLAVVLRATPAADTIGHIVRVLDPAAYLASLLVIVAACLAAAALPAIRAARLDPMETLRQN
jgi:predicted permease